MRSDNQSLQDLWQKIALGLADEQEKIDTAVLSGQAKDPGYVPHLLSLLNDEAGQVRYYALQSLILDLQHRDENMRQICWKFLREDGDEDVRAMAASCLGSSYFGSRSNHVFNQLVSELKGPKQSARAKASIYRALFKVAGRPPREWPGTQTPWKAFDESDIDWEKVAWLEDQMEI